MSTIVHNANDRGEDRINLTDHKKFKSTANATLKDERVSRNALCSNYDLGSLGTKYFSKPPARQIRELDVAHLRDLGLLYCFWCEMLLL